MYDDKLFPKMNTKKLVAISIVALCIVVMPAIAQENNTTANETNTTPTPPLPDFEPTTSATAEPTAAETAEPAPTEAKFRVSPTVTLRPVNDVIDKSQDGLVELYMNNPTLNDVTLTADVQVSVPSGIHVYGEAERSTSISRLRRLETSPSTSQGYTGPVTTRTLSSRSR
jgi:hypothetical protein